MFSVVDGLYVPPTELVRGIAGGPLGWWLYCGGAGLGMLGGETREVNVGVSVGVDVDVDG